MRVGDRVEVCRVYRWQPRSEAAAGRSARIERETKAQWVITGGERFVKATLSLTPRYLDYDIFIREAQQ